MARRRTARPDARPACDNGRVPWLIVRGARHNNLKDIDVPIPLGRFVCVTGVSGSGKSSLVADVLQQRLARDLNGAYAYPGDHDDIDGLEHLDKVIAIDQSPIGRTPRSNPATYIKVFDHVRALFARLPDSKVRGYRPGRFSFNVPTGRAGGGRCEACEGNGANRVEMDFLADVWVTCPVCSGRRFSRETLQVHYKGRSIADVLDMDVQQALEHFANIPRIAHMLGTLHDVGLDYLKLGQSSTTLSGGEAQRIKLARELVKKSTGRTLYVLDEPTTGLHFDDVRKLLDVLHGFVETGNTVVVIEHNLEVVKTADWVIDLGPEGGDEGGWVVTAGTPEEVAACKESYTGAALREVLRPRRTISRPTHRKRQRQAATNGRLKDITVVGAKQHNLKNITVRVPRDRITVCTGLSGSGKSSFAVDTVYTEGQRRYVESLSAYARQFLGQLAKPKVDHVYGLSPAIAIEQKAASKSPRSTVGTVTEIYDYMRVLWARLGQPYCPKCQIPIGTQSSDEIMDRLMALGESARCLLLAPISPAGSEDYEQLFARQKANGYARVRVDGQLYRLDEDIPADRRRKHAVELVVDRVTLRSGARQRLADSVEQALAVGNGVMVAALADERGEPAGEDRRFSQHFACDQCGTSYQELTPHHFSFNSRLGWCPACEGLGTQRGTSTDFLVQHPQRSVLDGAIAGWQQVRENPMLLALVQAVADHIGVDLRQPWNAWTGGQQHALLHGLGPTWLNVDEIAPGVRVQYQGLFPAIHQATRSSWQYRQRLEHVVSDVDCERCGGSRLQPLAANVRLAGRTITDVCRLNLTAVAAFFANLKLDRRQREIAGELLAEIRSRLRFLLDVGLEYLTLHRAAPTLSGGEAQRIRLASQIGSGLTGVLYVLDEPTIGLHPRDNERLIAALAHLRDLGNTLLMVEHDRDVIGHADHVLDFGPGAGQDGGRVVAAASPTKLRTARGSLTGQYLLGKQAIAVPTNRRAVGRNGEQKWLRVLGARQNNLKYIDVDFPLGKFICITGVSGSGKSSLVSDILYPALAHRIHRASLTAGAHDQVLGVELIDKVINVDQSPIGNSPTSNPATYTGLFDLIRELFAHLPASRVRGYTAARFSFNRAGGRCEACEGNGQKQIEMHFLPDVWVECDACKGRRYNAETLEVHFKGRSIADVLQMRVSEARELFAAVPKVKRMLQTLVDVGLDYVQLGQPAPTLSGGEAQRVKLAAELGRPTTGRTVYILDEPTTGLHFDDLRKLLAVLNRLADAGNTVICIEHNMDVIKTADWVIDLGPEAGDGGGEIVSAGPPERIAGCASSHTGRVLSQVLAGGPHAERPVFDRKQAARMFLDAEDLRLRAQDMASDARLPWEVDGRQWHTQQRPARQGGQRQWERSLLEWLVDAIEAIGGDRLAPTDWADRSRVEIKAPGNKTPWLFHALTSERMLLNCHFRVPRGTFKSQQLPDELGIKTLDERTDLPVYGQWQRVQVRPANREMDSIWMQLHDRAEADTPAFRRFLRRVVHAYLDYVTHPTRPLDKAEPWKQDGRKWHLGQKAIKPYRRKAWTPETLIELAARIAKAAPAARLDWSHKVRVSVDHARLGRWGRIGTSHAQGLKVSLLAAAGTFTPTRVEHLGLSPTIAPQPHGREAVSFWLQRMDQLESRAFAAFIRECESSLLAAEGSKTMENRPQARKRKKP